MADALLLPKRDPGRPTWLRVRKARPQLVLSRRLRRRFGTLRWCGRRRLRRRRRLLLARAAGVDWKEGARQGLRAAAAAAARRPETAAPSPAPAPAPACPASVPIPPVRPVGPGRVLLLLPVEQGFTFSGICRVTCLYGQVQVFGFTISQGQPSQDVFSTYTHTFLTINAVHYSMPEKSRKEMKREARTLLKSHLNLDDRCWAMKNFSPLCSIVMLEHLKTSTVNFITSYPGLSHVFEQENRTCKINSEYLALTSVGIKKEKKRKGLHLTESALSALEELVSVSCEEVDGCPVILVCGSQDIGKSTFNRYLINQLLNSISCVDYLECDLGQTEFTPPGCISLFNVTEPILGPPFTHQRTPQKMVYYGKLSCKSNCESYIEIIKYVFSSYKREAPLLINTMGWVADEGLLLLIDLIRLLSPSHVVQQSHNRILRELAVLGYLGQLQPPVPKPLSPLHGLTPYQVPFNAVALRITHSDVAPTHILYAVNASWVALCKILDDVRGYTNGPILLAQTPICDCLGFGICRGVDMEKRLYLILTPVPPEELRTVNCLLVGAISIPQCVFKNQRCEGTVPYVTTDYNFKLPGASEKIGARETRETHKGKSYPKPNFR
ncbi:polynucleotide 5'-hydroxyl-kinase NOL9 isoform X2 [Cynocephalus volans]|uniref:polynucleotide 5'-hydroxyl-kinase NOL9 isoform X2 n=1 Tax=Cynocephalus volans TaxID=110931 RepID=UPI002FC64B19